MYNLIRADLFKLRKSMAIKILFGITTVSAADHGHDCISDTTG